MYGAIIGDLAGSIYEYEQFKNISLIKITDFIPNNAFYSDDTILTMAILDAVLNNKDYEYYLKKYVRNYIEYKPGFIPYFKSSFSPGIIKWVNDCIVGTSRGNGAMMRVSAIGYLFDSKEEVIKNTKLATIPSHNSNEAIKCASLVALIIYLGRKGYSKEKIISELNLKYSYNPFKRFNSTCLETIDNCLYALFNSNSFEEAIRTVISYGGDTDTNACIVGSMAESLYGLDQNLILKTNEIIPKEFVKILNLGYSKIK